MMAKKRNLKHLGRRGLSLFMAMVMSLSLIQISAFAADPDVTEQAGKQIQNEGETFYYDKDGNEVSSLSAGAVSLSKTVTGTGIENKFHINLEVITTQDLKEISVSPDAAVMLVMDVSNSMVGENAMETIDGVTKDRLSWAKDATDTFLTNYVQEAGNAKRMVSVVEFGSNAKTVLDWTEANSKTLDSDGNTIVAEAASNGVDAVANGFTYYDCNQTGTHTCTTDVDFIEVADAGNKNRDGDWNWTGYGSNRTRTTCKVCGVQYDGYNQKHYHCTNPDCIQKQEDLSYEWLYHTHPVTTTYTGPHGDSHSDGGGTNMEGGLMLARNLIVDGQQSGSAIEGIKNLYVIILTDGVPTYHVSDTDTSTTELNFIQGTRGGGFYATYDDSKDIPYLAEGIKASTGATNPIQYGTKLYSLVYGSISDMIPISDNTDLLGYYTDTKSINAWLTDTVKVNHNYPSSNGGDINTNLGSIGTIIGTVTRAWLVTDSMPTDGIVTFSPGNLTENGGTFSSSNSEYLYYWDSANQQVVWDLKQETPTTSGSTFIYNLTYDVILNTEHPSFVQGTYYPTNGSASLSYLILDVNEKLEDLTPDQVTDRIQTAAFDVPTIHGYLGQFDFMKLAHHLDENKHPIYLGGAPFHMDNQPNAAVYKNMVATLNATSQGTAENETLGKVAFTGIPSGYTYTLSEADDNGNPTTFQYGGKEYETTKTTWPITVKYGEVSGQPSADGVENTLKQIPATLTLTKTWQVPSASSTKEIQVDLKQDGVKVATLTLNHHGCSSDNDAYQVTYDSPDSNATRWVYKLTVPSVNQETGGNYVYTTEEHSLGDGFTTTYSLDKMSITNTTTGKTSVSVKKEWLPIDGQEMTTKPPVTITLTATSSLGSRPAGTVTLPVDGKWTYTWDNLDAYDQGQPITYSVSEQDGNYQQVGSVTGQGTKSTPFVLTNTVLEGSIDIPVSKTWHDQNASDRPDFVTVELLRDGNSFSLVEGQTQTTYELTSLNADTQNTNVWTHTFAGLPQYQITTVNGQTTVHKYEYSVKELGTDSMEGYTSIKDGTLNLINTRSQDVSIEVTKAWVDSFDSHDEVTIALLQNGIQIDSKTTENGKVTFSPVAQFDINGAPYSYTVQEVNAPNRYTISYDYGKDDSGADNGKVVFDSNHTGAVTVTNTLDAKDDTVSVQVTKVWQHPTGTTAPDVTFTLAQLGKDGGTVDESSKELTAEDGTIAIFDNLPKYYYVQEQVKTTDETGNPTTTTEVKEYEYQYSVTESAIDGYNNGQPARGVQDTKNPNHWTFTNTITGTVTLQAEKVWKDLGEANRPTATIKLMRTDGTVDNGALVWTEAGKQLVTSTNETSENWTVDKYSSTGKLYTYKVVEDSVGNYTTSYEPSNATYTPDSATPITNIIVTNTLTQDATYNFTASKTWADNSNALNTRKAITLNLFQVANGVETSLGTVVVNPNGTLGSGTYTGNVTVSKTTGDQWSIVFANLQKYAYVNDNVYSYTYKVTEDSVDGYTTNIVNDKDITNTLTQDTTSVMLHKNWVDPANKEHPNVTFTLNAKVGNTPVTSVTDKNGNTVSFPQSVTLGFNNATTPKDATGENAATTGDDWYYTWENLPKYDNNQKLISYFISEGSVTGYTPKDNGNGSFTNTISQEYLDFDGEKVWNLSKKTEDDYLKPNTQNVTIALYYVNPDGSLGQMVEMNGLNNPVTIQPVTEENGTIRNTFQFHNLPRYNLSSGDELRYTVREVSVTTSQAGKIGYSPITQDGTISFTIADQVTNYSYHYTVDYQETPKTPATGANSGTNTKVTNTYQDPDVYFYRILGNYYTYLSGQLIHSEESVNLSGTNEGYIALTPEQRAALDSTTITAVTGDYSSRNGLAFQYDDANYGNEASVTLDRVNHMYTIQLNYVRSLYTLEVNYVFENTSDKPATGFENYTLPNWTAPAEGVSYTDPGNYLGNASYTGTFKAAPKGFKITQVTVKDSENNADTVDPSYNGGSFANHNVIVTYHYARNVINPDVPKVTDPSFTIRKVDSKDTSKLITHDGATFQVYTDAACTTDKAVEGKSFTTAAGTTTINASELGQGTWYLKESKAPEGYTASDTVWMIVVGYSESQILEDDHFVNRQIWTLAVTVNGQDTTALENANLTVPNTREYGYLTITKTVSGLEKASEQHTFKFSVAGNNYGTAYSNDNLSITVTGNASVTLVPILVPTGNYLVTETSTSAYIGGGYSGDTTYAPDTRIVSVGPANNTSDKAAGITVTNAYIYDESENNSKTINGVKLWSDGDNRDGLRPATVRVQLMNDGKAVSGKTADVSTTGDGAYAITYDSYLYDGTITVEEIGYTDNQGTYHEGTVPGYQISGPGTVDNEFCITNTHSPEQIMIQAHKVWSNGAQQAVTLRLYANGKAIDGAVMTLDGIVDESSPSVVRADAGNVIEFAPWTGAFTGTFYKYEQGNLINYTVSENALGSNWSYTTRKTSLLGELNADMGYLFTVTNTYTNNSGGGDDDDDDPIVTPIPPVDIPDDPTPTTDQPMDPGSDIPDEAVPTADLPDENVPTTDVPKTGDSLMVWVMAAAVSGVGLVWMALTSKKHKEDEDQ